MPQSEPTKRPTVATETSIVRAYCKKRAANTLFVLLTVYVCRAQAAPEEIQVYMDDINKPGQFGLEIHTNYVASGNSIPDYPGAQPPFHVLRVTPEFSWGWTPSLEAGLYLLTSRSPGGEENFDGPKLRLKYIAPHDEDARYFWGANLEVGKLSHRVTESPWGAELKAIFGMRTSRWTLAGNVNLDADLSQPGASSPPSADFDFKISYKTAPGYYVGIERYSELGPVNDIGHLNAQSRMLYAVMDVVRKGFDINFGIGRGLTDVSDQWVVKMILGFDLTD